MKRTFAAVALLAALGVLCKLAMKSAPGDVRPADSGTHGSAVDPEVALVAKYPSQRALVERTLDKYRQNAVAIERTDGLRGLILLDRLDLEAIFLYEQYPKDFRQLRDCLTDDAAADLLLHWRDYFGMKRAAEADRGVLIAEIARLSPAQRRAAARYPNALPLILAEPVGVTELIQRLSSDPNDLRDTLVILEFISLSEGAASLRAALRTLDHHGPMAIEAFRLQGPEGLALVKLYGPVIDALGDSLPLDQTLILLRVNSDYVNDLLRTQRPEIVAGHVRHAAALGLVEAVGGSPHALRLLVEYADRGGERALAQAGADAADVIFEDYADPTLRSQAVLALAEHGKMGLALLSKYATDSDFREILRQYGPPIIPSISQTDAGPETLAYLRAKPKKTFTESLAQGMLYLSGDNGQATIKMIKNDGLERVAALSSADVEFVQFLPLYDLVHLGHVVTRRQTPTAGEMSWALVDGCFVVADVLSLLALQPEGAVASEVARSEVKSATRETAKVIGREVVEEATEAAGKSILRTGAENAGARLSRWWTVRMAGGTYRLLGRLPEALPRMSLDKLSEVAGPFCRKAGLKLTTWEPVRVLKNGVRKLVQIPPEKGIKYAAAQALQATVGVVAFHKMEEHLQSRRPGNLDGD
jgi:hypothetical protein